MGVREAAEKHKQTNMLNFKINFTYLDRYYIEVGFFWNFKKEAV